MCVFEIATAEYSDYNAMEMRQKTEQRLGKGRLSSSQ